MNIKAQAMSNCRNCRFWSEMCAQSIGGSEMEALCLSADGPKAGRFTSGSDRCTSWKSGHLGAIDAPPNYGEAVRAAYDTEANC